VRCQVKLGMAHGGQKATKAEEKLKKRRNEPGPLLNGKEKIMITEFSRKDAGRDEEAGSKPFI